MLSRSSVEPVGPQASGSITRLAGILDGGVSSCARVGAFGDTSAERIGTGLTAPDQDLDPRAEIDCRIPEPGPVAGACGVPLDLRTGSERLKAESNRSSNLLELWNYYRYRTEFYGATARRKQSAPVRERILTERGRHGSIPSWIGGAMVWRGGVCLWR